MNKNIAQAVVGLPVEGPFDYFVPSSLRPAIELHKRVKILFNRRVMTGYVVAFKEKSPFPKLNSILEVLDEHPVFSPQAFSLTKKFSEYYGCSLGEAMETYLPTVLRRPVSYQGISATSEKKIAKNEKTIETLICDQSGHKGWEYLAGYIQQAVEQKHSIIFLVPEIGRINEVYEKLKEKCSLPIFIFDRGLPHKKELEDWQKIGESEACLVLGTRSAVFAPCRSLGLVVIYDEENEAYKQEQTPHYHAGEVAKMRAAIEKASLVWVSASPRAETWNYFRGKKREKIFIKAEGAANVQMIDLRNYNPEKTSLLTIPLQNNIQKFLGEKKRILLFVNRRGFTTQTRCNQCGYVLQCSRCSVNLTYIYSKKKLVCRYCQFEMDLPKVCPHCQGAYLRSTGTGIEKLESDMARYFPTAKVGRFDKDVSAFPREADIVLTTQAVLGCDDEVKADLVIVVAFDPLLNHMDFRSGHKAFALLCHLRQLAREKIMIQTRIPDNYCLKAFGKDNTESFYRQELKMRKELGLPPFRHLLQLSLRARKEETVLSEGQAIYEKLQTSASKDVEIIEPQADVIVKLRDQFRYNIMFKAKSVPAMLAVIKPALKQYKRKKGIIITINVDP